MRKQQWGEFHHGPNEQPVQRRHGFRDYRERLVELDLLRVNRGIFGELLGKSPGKRRLREQQRTNTHLEANDRPVQRRHGFRGYRDQPVELDLPGIKRGRDGELLGKSQHKRRLREQQWTNIHFRANDRPLQRRHGFRGCRERPVELDLLRVKRGSCGELLGTSHGERRLREQQLQNIHFRANDRPLQRRHGFRDYRERPVELDLPGIKRGGERKLLGISQDKRCLRFCKRKGVLHDPDFKPLRCRHGLHN